MGIRAFCFFESGFHLIFHLLLPKVHIDRKRNDQNDEKRHDTDCRRIARFFIIEIQLRNVERKGHGFPVRTAARHRNDRIEQLEAADHAYQSTTNPADWYFTAKIDGQQLKPQKMDAADLAAYQNKEMTVPQLMERYYPTKLMPKVSEEAFRMPMEIAGPDGSITVNKFNVYKEKDEQRPDFGKYKFYVQVGDTNMSAVASRQDLNAYFDRVATPNQLIEKNFGERLHLKSAYCS